MRKRIAYILMLIGLLAMYVWTNKKMTLWALAVLGLVLVLSIIINQFVVRKISIEYDIASDARTNANCIKVTITNDSIFPANNVESIVKCENIVFGTSDKRKIHLSVGGKSQEEFLVPIKSKYCGRIDLIVEKCLVYDWMDFSYRSVKSYKEGCYYAYPDERFHEVEKIKDGLSEGEEITYKHIVGNDISEILQIREYRKGDTIKNIHWKLSAKSGKLLVKEPDTPNDNTIMLLFDYDLKEERDVNNSLITAVSNISNEMMKERKGHTVYRMDTSEDRLVKRKVEEPEEFDVMQQELLETEAKPSTKKVADEIMDSGVYKRYAKVIYVCPKSIYGESGIENVENCVVVQI